MLDVPVLEKRWLSYKIKSYLPHIVIFMSISIIIFVVSFVMFFRSQSENSKNTERISQIQAQQTSSIEKRSNAEKENILSTKQEFPLVNSSETKVVNSNNTVYPTPESIDTPQNHSVILKPSFDFIKNINRNALPYNSNSEKQKNDTTEKSLQNVHLKDQEEINKKVEIVATEPIAIEKGVTQGDIEHVLKRFKQNNNPALSLFIAQKYYDRGDYNNAYNYALMTNELNNNIEDSWLIFTKSLIKMGKKDKAIKTLRHYIEYSNSQKASLLLENILSGKFQ